MRISDWSSDVCSSDYPRFSVSPDDAWWECGIWSRINELSRSGVRVIDGWAGATAELDCDNAVETLIEHPRVQDALRIARCLCGRIARDRIAQALSESDGQYCAFLSCYSRWARDALPIDAAASSDRHAIVLL